jgi:hypothetical protein
VVFIWSRMFRNVKPSVVIVNYFGGCSLGVTMNSKFIFQNFNE